MKAQQLTIEGGVPLVGEVKVSGAKNAALPILAACLLVEGDYEVRNVPHLLDIQTMIRMLKALRVRAELRDPNTVRICNTRPIKHIVPYELVTAMRASFFVAGPLLARTGRAKVPLPGGCAIGSRPLDLHFKGFRALGATVDIQHGFVVMKAKTLKGARICLDFPSVGATENILMAACMADGQTIIENAAREPEITDLGLFLKTAGAKIKGLGSSTITVDGGAKLTGKNYTVIPDRVEAATFMIAAAITKGNVLVGPLVHDHLEPLIRKLKDCGADVSIEDHSIRVIGKENMSGVDVDTMPFPGFPTDMQAQMMSLLTVVKGTSLVKESIFENRFMHARELMRMGADIRVDQRHAVITGVKRLTGAEVKITDLRAGAALILAGLAAEGRTQVYGLQHLRRGYEDLPAKLRALGGRIE